MTARRTASNSPTKGHRRALLLIDFINSLDFPSGPKLAPYALAAARRAAKLRDSADGDDVPVIYANDNFGHWRSDFRHVVSRCAASGPHGQMLVEAVGPRDRDLFVLKPMHSAFYCTPLSLLLDQLEVGELILAGIAADNCVQFTACDAYLRGYSLWIPADCVASESAEIARQSLKYMERVLKADISPSARRAARGRAPKEPVATGP